MKKAESNTIEYLKECFDLNVDTGDLIWKKRPLHHFANHGTMQRWNGKMAGKVAGVPEFKKNGKKHVVKASINKVLHQAHRVVYAIYHGAYPSSIVDHINGDPHDNRPRNLRLVTAGQNAKNSSRVNPVYGVRGITFFRSRAGKKPWMAQLVVDDKYKFLGYYPTKGEAALAYAKGSLKHHGKHSSFYRKEALSQWLL